MDSGRNVCLTICGILWSTYADVGNECEMNAWIQVECFMFLFFFYDLQETYGLCYFNGVSGEVYYSYKNVIIRQIRQVKKNKAG